MPVLPISEQREEREAGRHERAEIKMFGLWEAFSGAVQASGIQSGDGEETIPANGRGLLGSGDCQTVEDFPDDGLDAPKSLIASLSRANKPAF